MNSCAPEGYFVSSSNIVYNHFFLGIIPLCFDQKGNYFIIKKWLILTAKNLYRRNTYIRYYIEHRHYININSIVNDKQKIVNVKFSKKKGKQFGLLFSWTDFAIQLWYCWTLDYDFYLTWLTEFAGNNTIGNIQVCYAAALPVSIVERSWIYCLHQIFIFEIHMKGIKKS